jgi:hypothetical protein
VATFTERLELLITASSTQAVGALNKTGDATENLTTKQKAMGVASTGAKNALQSLGVPAEAVGSALGVAAGAGAAFAAVKVGQAAFDMAQHFADATAEVRAFQRVTGATAEDASGLVAVTKVLGINTDSAATGFFQLAKRIGQSKDTLDEHGAAVVRNSDGTVNMVKTVESAATAFQNMTDPAERAAFVMENFGKGGAALIPLLSKSRAELDEFFKAAEAHHEIFTQDDLDRGREFSVAMRELNQTFQGFKTEIGAAVIPVFTAGIKDATAALEAMDRAVSAIGSGISTFGNAVGPVVKAATGGAVDISNAFSDVGDSILNAIPGVGVTKQLGDLVGVFSSGADDTTKFTDAQQKGADAVKKMNELAAAGKEDTKAYADAHRDAAAAAATVASASAQVASSMQDEAARTFDATQQHLALAAANLGVQGSMLNLRAALDDQTKAQTDANNAAQFGVDQSADVEAADIKTQQAILSVVDAAQKRAVQALGPSANAEAQHTAAVDATTAALENMAATVPGTIGELQKLGYQVLTLPDGEVVVTANTTQAEQQLAALHQQIADFLAFASQPGAYGPFGVGASARPTGTAALSAAPAAVPAELVAPMALAAGAPAAPAVPALLAGVPASGVTFVVNVTTRGLGADAPEIQRAVVDALRGYVSRNGRLEDVTR